jgi:hypothetical protein
MTTMMMILLLQVHHLRDHHHHVVDARPPPLLKPTMDTNETMTPHKSDEACMTPSKFSALVSVPLNVKLS